MAAARISASDPQCTHALMSEPSSLASDHRGMSSTVIGPASATPGGGFAIPRANASFTPTTRR